MPLSPDAPIRRGEAAILVAALWDLDTCNNAGKVDTVFLVQ